MTHDVAQRHVPEAGPAHDGVQGRCSRARGADLARKEAGKAPGLAITVRPSTGRCEGNHRARPSALGQFKRQPHQLPEDPRGFPTATTIIKLARAALGGGDGRPAGGVGRGRRLGRVAGGGRRPTKAGSGSQAGRRRGRRHPGKEGHNRGGSPAPPPGQ